MENFGSLHFQGHPILVLTDQPLKQILCRSESSGHLAKWAINEEGTGAGLVLTSPDGEEYTYELKFCFYASNNEAEYETLLSGLRIALDMGITNLRAYVDSQIVAQQVNGTFDARDTSMGQYVKLVETISNKFDNLEVVKIPPNKNKKADVLRKLATLTFDHLHKRVLVEELKEKSIHEKPIMMIVEGVKETWLTPYLRYLHDGVLPIDKAEARRIRVTAPTYEVINGVLYRKSYNGRLLRSTGNAKFLVVAIDFFTKWVEAKALAKITGENVKKFVWHDIMCRYGVSNESQ
ncbi:uncharacterized protein [Rutidosis leptorrhynchoides]|uniref:uncharacterized protein n=1 Tax=Rutidosis leptorrhynchoides TaxID=125765 RepID=UPI003A99C5C6